MENKHKNFEASAHDEIVIKLNNLGTYTGLYHLFISFVLGIACYWFFIFSWNTGLIWVTCIFVLFLAILCLRFLGASIIIPNSNPITSGYRLDENSSKKLFSDLNDLEKDITRSKVDYVVIDQSANASMAQGCRSGLFKKVNVITIGWPLLLLLTKDEIRSIFAHELGHMHINQKDIRFHTRKMFAISQNVKKAKKLYPKFINFFFFPCLKYIFPDLEKYYYQISKLNEVRADEQEAKILGEDVAGASLLKLCLVSEFMMNEFYLDIESIIYREEELDSNIYHQFKKLFLIRYSDSEYFKRKRNYLLLEKAEETTHPRLAKRLVAIEYDIDQEIKFDNFANELYFPEATNDIHNYFNSKWMKENNKYIDNRVRAAKRAKERIKKFEIINFSKLSINRILKMCGYYGRRKEDKKTQKYFQKGIHLYPNNFKLNHFYGAYLFLQSDKNCLSFLKRSSTSLRYGPSSFILISDYHYELGDEKAGDEFEEKALNAQNHQDKINKERELTKSSKFKIPALNCDDKDDLILELERFEIKSCYITELVVQAHTDEPLYVLYVTPKAIEQDTEQQIIKLEEKLNFQEMFKIIFAGSEKHPILNSILSSSTKLF